MDLRVLLVEDNDEHAMIVTRYLRRVTGAKITLSRAATLAQALQQLAASRFDAVLLDLKLPDSDFGETVGRVLAQAPDMPLVVLSTLEEMEFACRALQEGAQDYLYKTDLSSELLFRALAYAIERQQAAEQARARARRQQALFEVGQSALSARTIPALLDRTTPILRRGLNVDVLAIWERAPAGESCRLASWDGCEPEQVDMSFATAEWADRLPPETFQTRHGLDSGFGVMIGGRADDETPDNSGWPWGIMTAHTRGRRSFGEDETHFLETAANVLGTAISRIRAEENLRRDIRKRERVEAALRENERLRETFIGVLGHDLRNPLAAMLTGARFALGAASDDRVRMVLERVLSSGDRMERMIHQLLDLTSVRLGGGIPLQTARTDLSALLEQALEGVGAERQRFRVEISGDTCGTWDPDRLFQLLANLVGNACEHSPPATPIHVRLDGRAAEGVALRIHNLGPAVPEPIHATIFEPFRRNPQQTSRGRGLGLGLYISRHLAEAHGGHLGCESTDASGTTFALELPRHSVHRPR